MPYETLATGRTLDADAARTRTLLRRAFYEVCLNCGFEFGSDDYQGTAPATSSEEIPG
jgi:hypothetical protein